MSEASRLPRRARSTARCEAEPRTLSMGQIASIQRPANDAQPVALVVDHLRVITKRDQRAIADEGRSMCAFLRPDAAPPDVRFARLS